MYIIQTFLCIIAVWYTLEMTTYHMYPELSDHYSFWKEQNLTPDLLNPICPAFANSVDPDQLASEEANWSESTLFVIMWIFINKLDQVIWLVENWKWIRCLNLWVTCLV